VVRHYQKLTLNCGSKVQEELGKNSTGFGHQEAVAALLEAVQHKFSVSTTWNYDVG
jgi:hypothetical protein